MVCFTLSSVAWSAPYPRSELDHRRSRAIASLLQKPGLPAHGRARNQPGFQNVGMINECLAQGPPPAQSAMTKTQDGIRVRESAGDRSAALPLACSADGCRFSVLKLREEPAVWVTGATWCKWSGEPVVSRGQANQGTRDRSSSATEGGSRVSLNGGGCPGVLRLRLWRVSGLVKGRRACQPAGRDGRRSSEPRRSSRSARSFSRSFVADSSASFFFT